MRFGVVNPIAVRGWRMGRLRSGSGPVLVVVMGLIEILILTVRPVRILMIEDLAAMAQRAEQSGDVWQAMAWHRALLSIAPANVGSANAIAMLYGKAGDPRSEIAWAKRAIAMNRHFEPAFRTLAQGLDAIGQHNDAAAVRQDHAAQKMREMKHFCEAANSGQLK